MYSFKSTRCFLDCHGWHWSDFDDIFECPDACVCVAHWWTRAVLVSTVPTSNTIISNQFSRCVKLFNVVWGEWTRIKHEMNDARVNVLSTLMNRHLKKKDCVSHEHCMKSKQGSEFSFWSSLQIDNYSSEKKKRVALAWRHFSGEFISISKEQHRSGTTMRPTDTERRLFEANTWPLMLSQSIIVHQ